jgi:hypothetical protein
MKELGKEPKSDPGVLVTKRVMDDRLDKRFTAQNFKLAVEILFLIGASFVLGYIFIIKEASAQAVKLDGEQTKARLDLEKKNDAGMARLERKVDALDVQVQKMDERSRESFFLLQKVILEGRAQPGLKPDAGGW